MIQARLQSYRCETPLEEENALKEITQEIALFALSRAGFFSNAEFHGGTALRILHGLQRFSEDLDFALVKPDKQFQLQTYLKKLNLEFHAYGYDIECQDRSQADRVVQKAFIKDDSIGKVLLLQFPQLLRTPKKIRIKLEVDTHPPAGATTELKYLDFPAPFSVLAKDLSSSFAGKIHALLCREYVKGRDWYDYLWYVAHKIQPNYILLMHALQQMGPWKKQNLDIDKNWLVAELKKKIESVDWQATTQDIMRFIKTDEQASLTLWNKNFFLAQLEKMA